MDNAGLYLPTSSTLSFTDRLGYWKARLGIGRMDYSVKPGLYAVGSPTSESVVLVSANYKMSFDRLRSQLAGRDAWILVLETYGINVWCAAGKGTFGTDELVNRLSAVGLENVVSHRKLVVPQLGAPGVSAFEVLNRSGFKVVFGPARAEDLPEFLDNGWRTTESMRKVKFALRDRLELIPLEIIMAGRLWIIFTACLIILSGFAGDGYSIDQVIKTGSINVVLMTGALFSGAVLVPVLLPWLPGRAFAVKGVWASLPFAIVAGLYINSNPDVLPNWASLAAWMFLLPVVSSFLGMGFTGASTYTSLSGVLKEMRIAVPMQVVAVVSGLALWVTGLFI